MAASDRKRGRGGRPGRKPPPPDATGREAEFLLAAKEEERPVEIQTIDGDRLSGTIEYYDRMMIKLRRDDGPDLFLRKSGIRAIVELDAD